MGDGPPIELNVMPFIDVFSLLTTFLLFSASFVTIGILEVQIPFFSSAVQPPDKPVRSIDINLDLTEDNIVLTTSYTMAPTDEKKYEFPVDEKGIGELHEQLYEVRTENPEDDKITMFVEDTIQYEKLIEVLDAVKFLKEGEAEIVKEGAEEQQIALDGAQEARKSLPLFPKVVMGDVILGKE